MFLRNSMIANMIIGTWTSFVSNQVQEDGVMSSVLSVVVEVVGTSAIVSAAVNFALEQWKFKKERTSARREEHLRYSIENYPKLATILDGVVDDLFQCRNLCIHANAGEPGAYEKFDQGLLDLLYHLRQLYSFEQEFQSKQGELFRLGNQSSEILAKFLYDLGKRNLYLTSDQEMLLVQKFKDKTLEEFRRHFKAPETEPDVKEVLDVVRDAIKRVYPERLARKPFDTLSRLLLMEIQSIRLPGYERKPIPLSKPDQDYIEAVKRIPTMFFSNTSIDDANKPLRIWVYNHWNHEISYQPQEVQMRICEVMPEGNMRNEADLDLFDPSDEERRKVLSLEPGRTLMSEWDRKRKDGKDIKGTWRIYHLPDAGDSSLFLENTQL
jgi:hypothetical protein